MTGKNKRRLERLDSEGVECAMDGFFGRTRICKFCKTPTKFDFKVGRYCPKGCFRGNRRIKK